MPDFNFPRNNASQKLFVYESFMHRRTNYLSFENDLAEFGIDIEDIKHQYCHVLIFIYFT